jgi:hypothetical protein
VSAFDALANEPRWVAWRLEQRGDNTTKIPYAPHGFTKAKSNDPATWADRAAAETRVKTLINGHGGGGIGIELGDLGGDLYLAGLDLDSCLGEDGALASWAQAILDGLLSYCEISPSGRGLKIFFYVITDDVRPFLDCIGVGTEQWGARRDVPGFDARKHGPAVEVYFSDRYFAVTENRWSASPDALATLDHAALEHLARHIPPARSQANGKSGGGSTGGDNSRSAKAFNKGREYCRRHPDCTFEGMAAVLRADPETANWCREKGDAAGGRELRNIWEKAQSSSNPEISRLASLDPLEYDQQREAAAERLGCRKSTLDDLVKTERAKFISVGAAGLPGRELALPDPEPWPEPVVGATLLDDIANEIKRYVILLDSQANAVALWALAVHTYNSFVVFPRLFFSAAAPDCGKTTSIEVVSNLVPRPLNLSSITAAAIYRVIEQAHPIFLLDEADTYAKNDEDLRGVLNAGHRRDGAVARCVETTEGYEVRQFSAWAPAALAAIGRLPNTLEDRSIIIRLERKLPGEKVEALRINRTERLKMLAQRAARFALDNATALAEADPEIPQGIENRMADNWRPLLAVADQTGGRWAAIARNVAAEMCRSIRAQSMRELLLEDLRELFDAPVGSGSLETPTELFTEEILKALHDRDDRPWPEFRDDKPITSRQMASLLKPLKVKTSRTVRRGDITAKGYKREWLADAFTRYLGPKL